MPAHAGAEEDEGWLIGLVIDTANETTAFTVLDARAFGSPPLAQVRLGHRIPPGFHGNWFPARAPAGPVIDPRNAVR